MSSFSHNFVTVVSGLPRGGTSMMMQMLDAGGLDVLTDAQRAADEDNLRGYYELEAVKRTRQDSSWLEDARGKVVKVIYMLLFDLPKDYEYRIIFMRRDVDEVVRSQQAMLERRGERGADISPHEMVSTFHRELERCDRWLKQQSGMQVLDVDHRAVIDNPTEEACRIREFLGLDLNVDAMSAAVDPKLYRQRGK